MGAPGAPSEASWGASGGVSGRLRGAFASSEDASEAKILKLWNSLHFLGFSVVCEVPATPTSSKKAIQEAAKAARRSLSEAGRPLAEHFGS